MGEHKALLKVACLESAVRDHSEKAFQGQRALMECARVAQSPRIWSFSSVLCLTLPDLLELIEPFKCRSISPPLLPAAFNHTGVLGDLMIKVMTKVRELKQQRIMASKMT